MLHCCQDNNTKHCCNPIHESQLHSNPTPSYPACMCFMLKKAMLLIPSCTGTQTIMGERLGVETVFAWMAGAGLLEALNSWAPSPCLPVTGGTAKPDDAAETDCIGLVQVPKENARISDLQTCRAGSTAGKKLYLGGWGRLAGGPEFIGSISLETPLRDLRSFSCSLRCRFFSFLCFFFDLRSLRSSPLAGTSGC